MATILSPLPDRDFDTTEVAVPWRLFRDAKHTVVFATEHGSRAPACDPLLLQGVLFGQLGADPEPKRFYDQLTADPAFNAPIAWSAIVPADYDALVLPGGHAPGMRQYLDGAVLQKKVAEACRDRARRGRRRSRWRRNRGSAPRPAGRTSPARRSGRG